MFMLNMASGVGPNQSGLLEIRATWQSSERENRRLPQCCRPPDSCPCVNAESWKWVVVREQCCVASLIWGPLQTTVAESIYSLNALRRQSALVRAFDSKLVLPKI